MKVKIIKGHWSYRPAKGHRGDHAARIRVGMNSESPVEYCSDTLRIQVYVSDKGPFFEQDIPFEKCWLRQG